MSQIDNFIREAYTFEIEDSNGKIYTVGSNYKDVVRVSFIPNNRFDIPRHDIFFEGFTYERRFAKVFMSLIGGRLKEYMHCVVTNRFRIYIRSTNGQSMIVGRNRDINI